MRRHRYTWWICIESFKELGMLKARKWVKYIGLKLKDINKIRKIMMIKAQLKLVDWIVVAFGGESISDLEANKLDPEELIETMEEM